MEKQRQEEEKKRMDEERRKRTAQDSMEKAKIKKELAQKAAEVRKRGRGWARGGYLCTVRGHSKWEMGQCV